MKKIYFTLLAGLIGHAAFADMVVHMLPSPVTVVPDGNQLTPYEIDLDNNGSDDAIVFINNDESRVYINGLNQNEFEGSSNFPEYGVPYTCGATISFYAQNSYSILDDFNGEGPRYLFMYFYDGNTSLSQFRDAWIKISVSANGSSFTIYGWGYTTEISNTMLAGEGECVNVAGLNDISASTEVSIYPNPTSTDLYIETPISKGNYQLQDITGKVVLAGSVVATKFGLDISALSKGVYMLNLFDDEQVAHRKIVKE